MELLTRNSKIKKSKRRTFNFGIPAYRSANGFKTCPNAAACAIGCYATMGAYRFSNVARVFEERLTATQSPDFEARMIEEIVSKRAERIRIHDSGDFYSLEYAQRWISIMNALPNVEFYAYIKMVSLFEGLKKDGKVPSNFRLIYSYGGTQDKLIQPAIQAHSRVFSSLKELRAAGYADVSKQDDKALTNDKVGLVYHGGKSYSNTNWSKVK
jgi:hypothetical protein